MWLWSSARGGVIRCQLRASTRRGVFWLVDTLADPPMFFREYWYMVLVQDALSHDFRRCWFRGMDQARADAHAEHVSSRPTVGNIGICINRPGGTGGPGQRLDSMRASGWFDPPRCRSQLRRGNWEHISADIWNFFCMGSCLGGHLLRKCWD